MKTPPKNISAPKLAERLCVSTATLGRWRREGYGPKGWFFVSATMCIYPMAEVEVFEEERRTIEIPRRDMVAARAALWRKRQAAKESAA